MFRTKRKLSKSILANKRDELESFGEASLTRVTPTVPPRNKVVSIQKLSRAYLAQIP